jgi:cytochrome c biogenesis protein CcmG/thiol:disulfide interchange protein DsbE
VDYVDAEKNALEYLDKFAITYPNGPDLRTEISDAFHIRGVPETFIVNADGDVVFYAARPVNYAELSAEIEKALASTDGS